MSDIQFPQVKPYADRFFGWLDKFTEFLLDLTPLYIQILLWVGVSNSTQNAKRFIVLSAIAIIMFFTGIKMNSYYKIEILPLKSYREELKRTANIFGLMGLFVILSIVFFGSPATQATFYSMQWVLAVAVVFLSILCQDIYSTAKNNRDFPVIVGVGKFFVDLTIGNAAVIFAFLFWQINLHGIHYFNSDSNVKALINIDNPKSLYAYKISLTTGLIYAMLNSVWYIYFIHRTNAAAEVAFGNAIYRTLRKNPFLLLRDALLRIGMVAGEGWRAVWQLTQGVMALGAWWVAWYFKLVDYNASTNWHVAATWAITLAAAPFACYKAGLVINHMMKAGYAIRPPVDRRPPVQPRETRTGTPKEAGVAGGQRPDISLDNRDY